MGIRGIGTISKYDFKKETIIVILAAVCVFGFTQNAYGDNLINNLGAATVDAGDTVTVSYKLQQTSANQGDPVDDCNVGGVGDGITATFDMTVLNSSPEEAGITFVDPAITFDYCSTSDRIDVVITTSKAGVFTIVPILRDTPEEPAPPGSFQTQPAVTVLTVIDVTPPVVTVPSNAILEATSAAGENFVYSATATDSSGVSSFSCTASGAGASLGTRQSDIPAGGTLSPATVSNEPGGETIPIPSKISDTTTFTCTAADTSGNSATGSFDVTVQDTTAPVVSINDATAKDIFGRSIAAGDEHDRNSAIFEFSAEDLVTTVLTPTCILDNVDLSSCASPEKFTYLGNGLHTFRVEATDVAGYTGYDEFTWEISTLPPVVTLDRSEYPPTDNVHIEVTDFGGLEATIEVELGTEPSNSISVVVEESGENNGNYVIHGLVQLVTGINAATDDFTDKLKVTHGDTITATYSGVSDSAKIKQAGASIDATPDNRITFNQDAYTIEGAGILQINLEDPLADPDLSYSPPDVLATGQAANLVIGQTLFTTRAAPSTPTSSSANGPRSAAFDNDGNVWVTDSINHRVLQFVKDRGAGDVTPTAFDNGQPASKVLCQTGFTTKAAPSTPTASSCNTPKGIYVDPDGNVWVADSVNHRVLQFVKDRGAGDPSATAFENGQPASKVLCQTGFTSKLAPSPPTASSCNSPRGLEADNLGNLYVSDTLNNRVNQYLSPFFTNQPAYLVIGQSSFITNTGSAAASATSLYNPRDVTVDPTNNDAWISDTGNHRTARYDATSSNPNTIQVYVSNQALGTPDDLTLNAIETTGTSRIFSTPSITFTAGANSQNPPRLNVQGDQDGDNVFGTYPSGLPDRFTVAGILPLSTTYGETTAVSFTDRVRCNEIGQLDDDFDGICNGQEEGTSADGLSIQYGSAQYQYADPLDPTGCAPLIDDSNDSVPSVYGSLGDDGFCPDPNIPDVYWELDYLAGNKPAPQAIMNIVNAFLAQNIRLHIQIDENLGYVTPTTDLSNPFFTDPTARGFTEIKADQFGTQLERSLFPDDIQRGDAMTAKRQVFHYTLVVEQITDSFATGWGEILGNDSIAAFGLLQDGTGTVVQQQGVLMHEFGHNLGLRHNADDDSPNCAPNYLSVMNYLYIFGGIIPGVNFPPDYARIDMNPINEGNLNDAIGITPESNPPGLLAIVGGIADPDEPYDPATVFAPEIADPGAAFDYNRVAGVQSGYSQNIHYFDISDCRDGTILTGTDLETGDPIRLRGPSDWPKLKYIFQETANFEDGIYVVHNDITDEQIAELQTLVVGVLANEIFILETAAFINDDDGNRQSILDELAYVDLLILDGKLEEAITHLDNTVRGLIIDNIENVPPIYYLDDLIALLDAVIDSLDVETVPADTAPSAANQAVETNFETPVSINLLANGDSPLVYSYTAPAYGQLTGTPPNLTYTPNADILNELDLDSDLIFDDFIPDSFTFLVTDGQLELSNVATVSIYLNRPDSTPVDYDLHLDANGSTLLLNPKAPTGTTIQSKSTGPVAFKGGNQWKDFGTWALPWIDTHRRTGQFLQATQFSGYFNLDKSNDQGSKHDIRVNIYDDNNNVLTSAMIRCVSMINDPTKPTLVQITSDKFTTNESQPNFEAPENLLVQLSARIGTNSDNSACQGKSQSSGISVKFDASSRDSLLKTRFLFE